MRKIRKIRKIFPLLCLIFSNLLFAGDYLLLCKGEEVKYIEGDSNSERLSIKVIGIQLYKEGMRLDGEWFANKRDLTEDYLLESSYVKSKDNIIGVRKFSTNTLIKGQKIQTVKIDKVEINILTNDIFWTHELNRLDKTNAITNTIYAFRKNFKGTCS